MLRARAFACCKTPPPVFAVHKAQNPDFPSFEMVETRFFFRGAFGAAGKSWFRGDRCQIFFTAPKALRFHSGVLRKNECGIIQSLTINDIRNEEI